MAVLCSQITWVGLILTRVHPVVAAGPASAKCIERAGRGKTSHLLSEFPLGPLGQNALVEAEEVNIPLMYFSCVFSLTTRGIIDQNSLQLKARLTFCAYRLLYSHIQAQGVWLL